MAAAFVGIAYCTSLGAGAAVGGGRRIMPRRPAYLHRRAINRYDRWANTSVAFITMSAPAPAILFNKLFTRARRLLSEKSPMKAVIFALSMHMRCQGVQAVLMPQIAAIFTADNPAENTLAPSPVGGRLGIPALCTG